jgi:C-terminal processing protease CtpA/Prc
MAMTALLGSSSLVEAQERGWIGINIVCELCVVDEKDGGPVIWKFSESPEIDWVVEDGPAWQGGLRAGDVLLTIEGVDLLTDEGGRMFGSMEAGVPVSFRVLRDGGEFDATVTPGGSYEDVFGKQGYSAVTPRLDSVQVQLKALYEGQLRLRVALQQAENALVRTELELRQDPSEERQIEAAELRVKIDSITFALVQSYKIVRLYADSLAARTLYVMPEIVEMPQVDIVIPSDERTVLVYSNAVAGARFQELDEDSPLVSDFEGVDGGLLIVRVVEDTPAYSAGLRQGDVVLAVDGDPVRTVAELRRRMRGEVELTYVRRGKKSTCKIGSN